MLGCAFMVPIVSMFLFGLIEMTFPGSLNNIQDEIILSFLTLIVVLIISFILLSLNFIIVNSRGIEIRTLFPKISLKRNHGGK